MEFTPKPSNRDKIEVFSIGGYNIVLPHDGTMRFRTLGTSILKPRWDSIEVPIPNERHGASSTIYADNSNIFCVPRDAFQKDQIIRLVIGREQGLPPFEQLGLLTDPDIHVAFIPANTAWNKDIEEMVIESFEVNKRAPYFARGFAEQFKGPLLSLGYAGI